MGRNSPEIAAVAEAIRSTNSLPVGAIVELATAAPVVDDQYLLCAGGVVNKADWPDLEGYVPPFSSVSSLGAVPTGQVFAFTNPLDMEFFAGYYWMLTKYALSKSADGVNWSVVLRVSGSDYFQKLKIAGDNAKLILVATNCFKYTGNGTDWTNYTLDATAHGTLKDVDTNGTRWVMVSTVSSYVRRSDDLVSWTNCSGGMTSGQCVVFHPGMSKWSYLTANAGSNTSNSVFYSSDGDVFAACATFDPSYPSPVSRLKRVGDYLFIGNGYLASANYVPYLSSDGISWSRMSAPFIDIVKTETQYLGMKRNSANVFYLYSGASPAALITGLTTWMRSNYSIGNEYGTEGGPGWMAASGVGDNFIFADLDAIIRRAGSDYFQSGLDVLAVSEDQTSGGLNAMSCGKKSQIMTLNLIDFENDRFILNNGVLEGSAYANVAIDKVFVSGTPHFIYAGGVASPTYVYAYKIALTGNDCIKTALNQAGNGTAGVHCGIKTSGPDKYFIAHAQSTNINYASDAYANRNTGLDATAPSVKASRGDGIIWFGPYNLNGATPAKMNGFGTTNKSTGAITGITVNMTYLSAVLNGTIILTYNGNFYRPGEWGMTDMTTCGPTPGTMIELNECAAGYFVEGTSSGLYSYDGYNWVPFQISKGSTTALAYSLAVSYAAGKLFVYSNEALTVYAASEYDPKSQVQLPNIKGSKPGVNTYIKAA